MITEEMIRQATRNLERMSAKDGFHFPSFVIGLAIGLVICGIIIVKIAISFVVTRSAMGW